jgi:hypothetical protein
MHFYDKALINARDEIILNPQSSQTIGKFSLKSIDSYSVSQKHQQTQQSSNEQQQQQQQQELQPHHQRYRLVDSINSPSFSFLNYSMSQPSFKPNKLKQTSLNRIRFSLKKLIRHNNLYINKENYFNSVLNAEEKASTDSYYLSEFLSIRL